MACVFESFWNIVMLGPLRLVGESLKRGSVWKQLVAPYLLTDLRLDLPIGGPSGRCEAEIACSAYLCGS